MRYLPLLLLAFLASCASQDRYSYDDPWDDPATDTPRHTYDESYVPPSRMDADQLVARAQRAEQDGRDDQARVDYQQAFRRDRWHPGANTGYQDLMLRNGLFDEVWQEYLDLWQQNPSRGDALWFHLRPMLIQRADEPLPLGYVKKLSADKQARVDELTGDADAKLDAGDSAGAVAVIEEALEIADLTALHRRRIQLLQAEDYDALLQEYADRAEENPANGDNLYLHARVVAYRDPQAALGMLRDGWILDLPGWWLRFGMGEISRELADAGFEQAKRADVPAARSCLGYYGLAEAFFNECKSATPDEPETLAALDWIASQRKRLG
ncbi:MAG: hypothetical protein H6839_15590 [Planctomycetes bacterium]|nr:hypothetical protein [Planctomycetota bacterium]